MGCGRLHTQRERPSTGRSLEETPTMSGDVDQKLIPIAIPANDVSSPPSVVS